MTWLRPRASAVQETLSSSVRAEPDEAALVAAAQACPRDFAPLYLRYLDAVFRYSYHRLGNHEAAEDATSQIFLQALAALPRYQDRQAFRSWLFTIAHHVITDIMRCRKPIEALDEEIVDAAPTPEVLALGIEGDAMLRRALSHLPESQQRVVELRLAGLSGAEIAEALGRQVGAIKMLQLRAVKHLRILLEDESRL